MTVYLDIVDVLGSRLYSGKTSWLREYIQNSIDANAHNINVKLQGKDFVVEDDGEGISYIDLKEHAFSPGGSSKSPSQIGELGVGLFAGTGISTKVKILTKRAGENGYEAVFDVEEYRKIINEDRFAIFDEHIGSIYSVYEVEEKYGPNDHFTKLMLLDLEESALVQLREEIKDGSSGTGIQDFIEKNIGVEVSDGFKFKSQLERFLGIEASIPKITIELDGNIAEIRKFMHLEAEFIDKLYTREFRNAEGKVYARAWAAYSKDGGEFSGSRFVVKFKGMTIGDETTIAARTGERVEKRLLGEVYAYSDKLRVNTERNWFVESKALTEFMTALNDVRSELFSVSNTDSQVLKAQVKFEKKAAQLNKELEEIDPKSQRGKDLVREKEKVKTSIEELHEKGMKKSGGFKAGGVKASRSAVELLNEIKKEREEEIKLMREESSEKIKENTSKKASSQKRKSPIPNVVRRFLTEQIVDQGLGGRIRNKDDVKDLSNNAFTYIEILLKSKVSIKPSEHIDFKDLVSKFLMMHDPPPSIPNREKNGFIRSFREVLMSTHHLWRNPSAHTFMDDIKDDRFLFQAIMVADFAVKLINDFVKKP